jgi:hypothetical protein
MMIKNKFLSRIFNKLNINKILIIFSVGFISRIIINYLYGIDIFLAYYLSMSIFTVVIHEAITYFNFNIIPSFSFIKKIFSYKLEDIKISCILKGIKHLINTDKDRNIMYINEYPAKNVKVLDDKSLVSNVLEKNDKDGSKKKLPRQSYKDNRQARDLELRLRREEAARLARDRLASGLLTQQGNTDTYTSRYDSPQLPPIYTIPPRINNDLPVIMPRFSNLPVMEPNITPNPPVMQPDSFYNQNNTQGNSNNNTGNNNTYNSQSNNNSTESNQNNNYNQYNSNNTNNGDNTNNANK